MFILISRALIGNQTNFRSYLSTYQSSHTGMDRRSLSSDINILADSLPFSIIPLIHDKTDRYRGGGGGGDGE